MTGNAIILKPSPLTPYCNLKMAELGLRFFPPGVFQALSGDHDIGPYLVEHPGVGIVSFTGSTAAGQKVMESCSKTLKRVTLELGGNDAAIVCADVNPVETAPGVAFSAFLNSGQVCSIPKRVYVHEAVYDEFMAVMVAFAQNLSLNQDEHQIAIGPVSHKRQYERVQEFLRDIEANKLTVAAGSTKPLSDRPGYFLSPTIIDNPPEESRVVAEEVFGPVVPVLKWSDEADVIRRANDSDYGLAATVWSKDIAQAERIAQQLEVGTVWINTHPVPGAKFPFAGHKMSGLGVEWGIQGMKGYCNLQTIHTKLA
ncbi:betaine aldehyde dehydrogenase [Xylariomycetidae sp. FL2044]|nr:betaine aldehyde dehydrogenase [Xylariomycetidae sp. FL2044]